ncbi:MAG: hypothetical protein HY036_05360 [Nitrospirae bacterium]|nr:hypothetical protein [Nitrospirota bacterium]MBI3351989.1 hypothetical protein [Nitrospirota bacterium]
MGFKTKFYIIFFIIISLAVIIIDQYLGKLYVRYMILFTSTFFLLGMQYGQRLERRWLNQLAKMKKSALTKAGTEVKTNPF